MRSHVTMLLALLIILGLSMIPSPSIAALPPSGTTISFVSEDLAIFSSQATYEISSGGLADSPWPMFRHDPQHTGRSQYLGPRTNTTRWKLETGVYYLSSAAVGPDDIIYVGGCIENACYLHAINPDGSLKWKTHVGVWVRPGSSPAIGSDGAIYIGGSDGYLYAINPDGSQRWKLPLHWLRSSPSVGPDGTIYIGSDGQKLHAINPDGSLKWEFNAAEEFRGEQRIRSSPAIGPDGTVYVGSTGGYLFAVGSDGRLRWKIAAQNPAGGGNPLSVVSSPAIGADGTVYVGGAGVVSGALYAFNPDGTMKWSFRTRGTIESSPSIGSDGTIYVGSSWGDLYAINPDGTSRWEFVTENAPSSLVGYPVGSPVIGADDTIYVSAAGAGFYAFGPTGNLEWRLTMEGWFWFEESPSIGSDGVIYVGAYDLASRLQVLFAIGNPQTQTTTPVTKQTSGTTVITPTTTAVVTGETPTTRMQTATTVATTVLTSTATVEDGLPSTFLFPFAATLGMTVAAVVFALALRRRRRPQRMGQSMSSTPFICPQCARQLPHDAAFCDSCGVRIRER